MPRKQDIPAGTSDFLQELRVCLQGGTPLASGKMEWYRTARERHGQRTADLVLWLFELKVSPSQVNHYYIGENTVPQQNNPGGTNVTQTAGGNMTGVNATGDQKIRDINVYSQDLDQAGATINPALKSALVEARRAIEAADAIDAATKPMILEQFDKLTEELKKGDKKNQGVVSMLWNMVNGAVKVFPPAVAALEALETLRGMLGGG